MQDSILSQDIDVSLDFSDDSLPIYLENDNKCEIIIFDTVESHVNQFLDPFNVTKSVPSGEIIFCTSDIIGNYNESDTGESFSDMD